MALTSKDYWNRIYQRQHEIRRPMVNPRWSYFGYELLRFIDPWLPRATLDHPVRLLEMGCGGSRLLPYFAAIHGYDVAGIDYSLTGCRIAMANIRAVGCRASIWCTDFRQLGPSVYGRYDVVLSCGVVEHFDDFSGVLGQFARCLAPGGIIVTTVPNLCGVMGWIQRVLGRNIYDMHVRLDLDDLVKAHQSQGLQILAASPLGALALGMLNTPLNAKIGRVLAGMDVLHLWVRRALGLQWQSPVWSSYFGVVARRSASVDHA
jgi:2-polyprenyl-3-methyl-5-hydroxy-6-metoxy-1,4-benzoquinol methylase